jgi:hypothetical protein
MNKQLAWNHIGGKLVRTRLDHSVFTYTFKGDEKK